MCQFLSWVEKDEKVYLLTGEQVYRTERGKKLQEWSKKIEEDKLGHGAIRFYYRLKDGLDKECSDFSSPANFPPEIVTAIKAGKMREIANEVVGLLSAPARAEYDKVCATARAEHGKVCAPAWAEYDKVCATAWAEYDKVLAPARAEYDKARAAAFWDLFADSENRAEAWR